MQRRPLSWSTIAAAVLTWTTTGLATSWNASIPKPLEVDVLYPQSDYLYGFDINHDWIPVVYVLHNSREAVQHANIQLHLALQTTGIVNAMKLWTEHITQANVDQYSNPDGSPFLLIKSLNINDSSGTNSDWTEAIDTNVCTKLSLVSWLNYESVECTGDACEPCQNTPFGKHDFQILWLYEDSIGVPIPGQQPNQPSPIPINAMPNITSACAEPAIVVGFNPNATAICQKFSGLPLASASPCAVTLDAQAVSSVSSVAASIASASPTPTTFNPYAQYTFTPSRAHAMATAVPAQLPMLAAAAAVGVLGGAGLHFG